MLQTAPIMLLFPPTIGTGAKTDGQPIRYDFTMGLVSIRQYVVVYFISDYPQVPVGRTDT